MAHQFELMDVPDLGDDDDVSYLRSMRRGTNNTMTSGGGLCYNRNMSMSSQKDESARSVISSISADGGSVLSGTAATYPEWLALRQANHINHNNLPSLPNRLVEEALPKNATNYQHHHHTTKDDNTSSTSSATDDASDPHLAQHDHHHQQQQPTESSDHFPTHFSSNNTITSSSSKSTSYRTGCFSSEGYRRNFQHVQQKGHNHQNNSINNSNNHSIVDDDYSICRAENDDDTMSRQPMTKGSNKSIASYSQNTDHNIKVDMTVRTEPHPLEEINKVQAEYIQELESRVAGSSFECATLRSKLDSLELGLRKSKEENKRKDELIGEWQHKYNSLAKKLSEVEKDMLGLQNQQQQQQPNNEINNNSNPRINFNKSHGANMDYLVKDMESRLRSDPAKLYRDPTSNVWKKFTLSFRNSVPKDPNFDSRNNIQVFDPNGSLQSIRNTSAHPTSLRLEEEDDEYDEDQKQQQLNHSSLSSLDIVNISSDNDDNLENSDDCQGPFQKWFRRPSNQKNDTPIVNELSQSNLEASTTSSLGTNKSNNPEKNDGIKKWWEDTFGHKKNTSSTSTTAAADTTTITATTSAAAAAATANDAPANDAAADVDPTDDSATGSIKE